MSDQLAVAMPSSPRTSARPIFVAAGVAALLLLGLARLPDAANGAAAVWHDGNWLGAFIARFAAMLPAALPPQMALIAFATLLMSLLIAWLYERLLYNDWSTPGALLVVAALACNAAIPGVVASGQWAIATIVACILLVPGIRRVESVGDVQANMSFGLVLPVLFLAGPAMAPLILPLALFGALSDIDARRDIRAFVAMFLVAIMPTLLVLTGMLGMFGFAETGSIIAEVYVPSFTPSSSGADAIRPILTVAAYMILPFVLLIGAYMAAIDRRWQPVSAAVVLALPLYLIAGASYFGWPMAPSLPLVAFLGAFASWLSVARLQPNYRRLALALLILTAALSWTPKILPLLVG
jgi:hypothetical protein